MIPRAALSTFSSPPPLGYMNSTNLCYNNSIMITTFFNLSCSVSRYLTASIPKVWENTNLIHMFNYTFCDMYFQTQNLVPTLWDKLLIWEDRHSTTDSTRDHCLVQTSVSQALVNMLVTIDCYGFTFKTDVEDVLLFLCQILSLLDDVKHSNIRLTWVQFCDISWFNYLHNKLNKNKSPFDSHMMIKVDTKWLLMLKLTTFGS